MKLAGKIAEPGRTCWVVNRQALPAPDQAVFESMEALLRSPMEQVTLDSRSGVSRLPLQSVYYVKLFKGRGSCLRHWLGTSRFQRELRNLRYFRELGLGTPDIVAYGQVLRLGLLRSAVLVTAEVEDAVDLARIIRSGQLYAGGVAGARRVLGELARATRLLHAQGFYHKDLKTRNILVRLRDAQPELFFLDCPSGRHPPRFLMRRSMVRDLAHLEEGLRGRVRRVDMLYMYKHYLGTEKLSEQDKALARAALCYEDQRRMTRKRRRRERQKLRRPNDGATGRPPPG